MNVWGDECLRWWMSGWWMSDNRFECSYPNVWLFVYFYGVVCLFVQDKRIWAIRIDSIAAGFECSYPNLEIKGSTGVPTNLKLNQYIFNDDDDLNILHEANSRHQKPNHKNLIWNKIPFGFQPPDGPYHTTTNSWRFSKISKHFTIIPNIWKSPGKKNSPGFSTTMESTFPHHPLPPQSIVDAKSCDRILFTQKTFGERFIAYHAINWWVKILTNQR